MFKRKALSICLLFENVWSFLLFFISNVKNAKTLDGKKVTNICKLRKMFMQMFDILRPKISQILLLDI